MASNVTYYDPKDYSYPGFNANSIAEEAMKGINTDQIIKDTVAQYGGGGAPAGGTGPTFPALNQKAVDNTQRAIDEIPGLLDAALDAERRAYGNVRTGFDSQEGQQKETYDKSTTTNQQNYDQNYMASILAGIKGLGGLFQLLRGSGAAGGTAEDMVRNTVGGVTANDIRTGADTRNENQSQLDNTLQGFLTELRGKREQADDTFENNKMAIRRDSDAQLQELLGKMAGYFGDAGQTDRANEFMDRAGRLTPRIADNSKRVVSTYDRTPISVAAPELAAFADPSQPEVATAPVDGQVGSGIFTMSRRKNQAALQPVGA